MIESGWKERRGEQRWCTGQLLLGFPTWEFELDAARFTDLPREVRNLNIGV